MDDEFVKSKYEELKANGPVIILEARDVERFSIRKFNRDYSDANASSYELGGKKEVFLKRVGFVDGDIVSLMKQAEKAYQMHDTDTAIRLYETLLLLKKPQKVFYARLGLLYLSKNDVYRALPYLKIATGLSLKSGEGRFNFTPLINKILRRKNVVEEEEVKPFVHMSLEDFDCQLNMDYGITRVKDVCILMEYQGMSIDEACAGLCIGEDDKNMITLIIARDCYARDDVAVGDEFVAIVERVKNKSTRVKKLLEEIKINKRFYRNRVDEDYKPLLRSRILN